MDADGVATSIAACWRDEIIPELERYIAMWPDASQSASKLGDSAGIAM